MALLQNGQLQLIEGAGRDILAGSSGNDVLIAGPGGPGAVLEAGTGNNTLIAQNYGVNTLSGGSSHSLLLGGNLENFEISNSSASGGNTLVGGLGIDNLQAGAGTDTLYASYNAAAWSQGEAAAAAVGVHIVPPQLFQGDPTAAQLQTLLQAQQAGPLTQAQQNQLIALLSTEFNALSAEEANLNTQVSNFLAIPNLSQNPTLKAQLIAVAQQDEFVQTETTALLNQILNALGASGFQEDRLLGGSGGDAFYGNIQGATQMGGGSGAETFYNYNPSDIVQGGSGANTLVLQDYSGNNTITLSQDATNVDAVDYTVNGKTLLVGDTGNVSNIQTLALQLGTGNDNVTVNFATLPPGLTGIAIQCSSGNDLVDASVFTGNETLTGGSGNDVIEAGAIIGQASQFVGTPTSELDLVLQNGSGSNTVTVKQAGLQVNSFDQSGVLIGSSNEPLNKLTAFGKLVVLGGAGANTITTDGSVNVELDGGSGSNVFNVSGGTARLVGGGGSNSFNINGPGNYTVIGAGIADPAGAAGTGVTAPLPESGTLTHTTATLSQARGYLAATSVGTEAFFAGGYNGSYSSVVDIYDASTGNWTTASLSQARDRLSAATVGTEAFFAGGYNGSYSSVVDIYDASTGKWTTASLSQARYDPAATTVGTKVLFAGGSTATATSSVVDIYDASTGQWSTASLSQARYALTATTAGNEAFFAGGATDLSNGYSSVVDIYNATSGQWSTASLSWPRVVLSATSVGSKALFAGGISGGDDYEVDIYDTETGQWSTDTLSQPEGYLAATTVGTKAIFAGGVNGSGYSNSVDIFDTAPYANSAGMTNSRANLAAATVGSKAIFVGGDSANQVADIYDVAAGQWSNSSIPQWLGEGTAATTVGSKAIFAGGFNTNAIDIYDDATGQWSSPSVLVGGGWLAATTVGSKALFAGGYRSDGSSSAAVVIYDAGAPAGQQWSSDTLSQARYYLAAATVGTKAFFAGGYTGSAYSDVVDVYDASAPAGQRWSTYHLSQARGWLTATTVGTKVFFAGGKTASGYSSVVDIYDNSTGQWTTASLSQPRGALAATTVGTVAIFAGGANANGVSSVVDVYDDRTAQWYTDTLSEARSNLAATTVGIRAIFAGGFDSGNNLSYTVDIFHFPPIVSNIVAAGTSSGITTIGYRLAGSTATSAGYPLASIQVQYSVNGGPWQVATAASGGDGTGNLTAVGSGTAHTFLWNSLRDLGATSNPSVQVRITPSDNYGIGVTQVSGPFEVNNTGVVNALTIAITDSRNDTITLTQSGQTVSFNGSVAGGSLNLLGTAANMTSVTVNGGSGDNKLDASGVQMPVSLYGGVGSGADTLIGGAGSDILYYSGVGSSYDGGGGVDNVLTYPSSAGDLIAFGGGSLVLNNQPKPLGPLTRIENFLASGPVKAVNNAAQSFVPVNNFLLSSAAITGVTVATGATAVTLTGAFTDPYPSVTSGTDAATIDWGDGTTSTGTIAGSGGRFTVSASHVYATEALRVIGLTLVDPNGSAISGGQSFTGGLALDGSGDLKNYSSASASATIDTSVSSYVVRDVDGTVFALHTDGSLWAIPITGSKTQVDGGDRSIALGLDGRLYVLHADGSLYAAPPGSVNPTFVETGVSTILADTTGDLYKLYTTGALSAMPVNSTTWTPVLTNVKSVNASAGGVNVVTNAGVDWQFVGTAGTLIAGPHLAFSNSATFTAGRVSNVTLAVLDVFNNPVLGYSGTLTFSDSDAPAVASADGPPLSHTFTAADNGAFSFPITFLTSGPQTLTVVDTGGLTTSTTVTVRAGAAVQFSVDPPPVVVGTVAPITVTAYDAYGNVSTGYTGPVTLTPVDGDSASPMSYTFTAGDQATHEFGVTFLKTGGEKLVATGGGLAGNGAILVNSATIDSSKSTLSVAPSVVVGGDEVVVTFIARDREGNQETGGGQTVDIEGNAGDSPLGPTVDNEDGTYTRLFTVGTHPGLDNFSATINGVEYGTTSATVVAATNVALTFSPTQVIFGQSVNMNVTVSSISGTSTPSGAVTFLDGATVLGTSTLDGNGRTTFSTADLSVGAHPITARYSGDADDAGSVVVVNLNVGPNATLSLGNLSFTYDGSAKAVSVVTSPAGVTGVTISYAQNGVAVPEPTAAGSYVVTASLTNSNFVAATITGILTINQATPTVTWANPASITYGTPLGPGQLDATPSVKGTFNYGPPPGTLLNPGLDQALGVIFTPTDSLDYATVTSTATIDVLATTTTILAVPAATFTYQQSVKLTAAVSPTAGGITPTGSVTFFDGTAALGTAPLDGTGHATFSTADLSVGAHSISSRYSGDARDVGSVGGSGLNVAPNATLTFGSLVFTYDGTSKAPVVTTGPANLPGVDVTYAQNGVAVPEPTAAGSYVVTASLTNPNFVATTVTGTLTINQATPTVTWANPASITYGTPLGPVQLDATPSVSGSFAYATPSGTVLNAGQAQVLSVAFTPTDTIDYRSVTATVQLNVSAAPLTIIADDANSVVGELPSTFTAHYRGFVLGQGPSDLGGVLVYSTAATNGSPPGTYPIVPGGLLSSNYAIQYLPGNLSLSPRPIPLARIENVLVGPIKVGRKRVQAIVLTFDAPLAPGSAQSLGNYVLDSATHSKKFGTRYSKAIPLKSASYNPTADSVTLFSRRPLNFSATLQLTAGGPGLLDSVGRPVDGKGDGVAGSAYVALIGRRGVQVESARTPDSVTPVSALAVDHLLTRRQFKFRGLRHRGGDSIKTH